MGEEESYGESRVDIKVYKKNSGLGLKNEVQNVGGSEYANVEHDNYRDWRWEKSAACEGGEYMRRFYLHYEETGVLEVQNWKKKDHWGSVQIKGLN